MGRVGALLLLKGAKFQFPESFSSYPKEIEIKKQVQIFSSLVVGSDARICTEQRPLLCTHVGKDTQKSVLTHTSS